MEKRNNPFCKISLNSFGLVPKVNHDERTKEDCSKDDYAKAHCKTFNFAVCS
uniref:Uncharacterized protein n=1 Tax=Octopus bimaculoides TaxID=37653 RepID=A0A0L8FJD3_OCTBM